MTTWLATSLWLASSACTQSFDPDDDLEDLPPPPPGVGEEEWGKRDISCSDSSDCSTNESCIEGTCQMQRCTEGPYDSNAPLGEDLKFFTDREILAADSDPYEGGYFVDGYLAENQQITPASSASWNFGNAGLIDVAGGDFFGGQPERFAVAKQGETHLSIRRGGYTDTLDLGFVPAAVAAGDTDRSGRENIVAVGPGDEFALCDASEGTCSTHGWADPAEGLDVTAGDVDADGYDEVVFFLRYNDNLQFVVWNPHYEETGQDEFYETGVGTEYKAIAAGDLTGDGYAEVVGLGDGGWFGFADDGFTLYRFEAEDLASIGEKSAESSNTKDVAIGDLNMSGQEELILLHDDKTTSIFQDDGAGSISKAYQGDLSVTSNADRISTADINGDSPSASRVAGPEVISGPVVPIMAANFPPYDAAHSGGGGVPGAGGGGTSNLFIGNTESTSETFTDSAHIRTGVQVGFEAELFGVLGTSVKGRIQNQVEYAESTTEKQVIGNRFFVLPEPDRFGSSYGVVLLSGGCFHGYTYEMNDPDGRIDDRADGSEFLSVVPVDGQVTLWSTNRYNALAEQLDYLPKIEVNTEIGVPDSYPESPERSDGTPIPSEDMVFTDPPEYLLAETGRTGWWLTNAESESQEVSMSTEVGVLTSLSAGATVEFDSHVGIGNAYSVSLGEELIFSGAVPAIEDDPDTPGSEYEKYAFSFAPYVYRETYTDPDGEEAGYYMLNYTVGR